MNFETLLFQLSGFTAIYFSIIISFLIIARFFKLNLAYFKSKFMNPSIDSINAKFLNFSKEIYGKNLILRNVPLENREFSDYAMTLEKKSLSALLSVTLLDNRYFY